MFRTFPSFFLLLLLLILSLSSPHVQPATLSHSFHVFLSLRQPGHAPLYYGSQSNKSNVNEKSPVAFLLVSSTIAALWSASGAGVHSCLRSPARSPPSLLAPASANCQLLQTRLCSSGRAAGGRVNGSSSPLSMGSLSTFEVSLFRPTFIWLLPTQLWLSCLQC